ncbi:hypothetical protein EV356DRAFT_223213 [Viridothelium virens]|uniref:Oxo-4-hydroxy-4-carboxy-5-ureidoimidazoline decarboxylase domain-containing protein n=1 Tax=Viridothelium virens TaxID=1048519 RepID=A0A6A6HM16_VIRVR|nr:hypothetical protein EV356DRAFT_223213 [Viridothelium virens]
MDTSLSRLPPIWELQISWEAERAAVLDTLFEPSVPLHTLSLNLLLNEPFTSYNDLIAAVGAQLTELSESSSPSDKQLLDQILCAHPRLGAKKVESAQSQYEQAQLQGGGQEAAQLMSLNDEYEKKFPGLRYVTFVNGRSRQTIMEDMRARITGSDTQSERAAAIKAMCEIATDRERKLS